MAGLIDGDGYIAITRDGNKVVIRLVISLDMVDQAMLLFIRDTLGFGRVTAPTTHKSSTKVKLIFSRTELQELLFPLFIHHGIFFLTHTRRAQFDRAMYVIANQITKFDMIPSIIPASILLPSLPSIAADYLELPFFSHWVVGFTNAEGSFLFKANGDACFQLSQRLHLTLFEALKLVFKTNRSIGTELGKYHRLSMSSKKDIQTVIDFFNQHSTLMGHKLSQYNSWIMELRKHSRYHKFNF